jgi:hypothetical protein
MTPSPQSTQLSETLSAIQTFEQILDAFPDDLTTLEALFQTYESIGETDKAGIYILRAGQVAVQQSVSPVSSVLIDRLQALAPTVQEAAQLLAAMGEELIRKSLTTPVRPAAKPVEKKIRHPMEAETALTWTLKEASLLTDAQYASIVRELTEATSSRTPGMITLLGLLQDREPDDFEKVINYLAQDAGTAILPISHFDTPPEIAALLPLDFMTERNISVFEAIGSELMVAVLNPQDLELRKEVEQRCGRTCHFFLTPPSEMRTWLQHVRDSIKPSEPRG